jgi:hypothetical protein
MIGPVTGESMILLSTSKVHEIVADVWGDSTCLEGRMDSCRVQDPPQATPELDNYCMQQPLLTAQEIKDTSVPREEPKKSRKREPHV